MKIPVKILEEVYHIGTMNPADRGKNCSGSLEGHCLSVSRTPAAWQTIARLGGFDLHRLSTSAGVFLDVVRIADSPRLMQHVLAWGKESGLFEERTLWRTWFYDEEVEEWSYFLTETAEEGYEELGGDEHFGAIEDVPGPVGRSGIEQTTVPVGTSRLAEVTGSKVGPTIDATDDVIMAWGMLDAPEIFGRKIDGVWWRAAYDPRNCSAPRGGIFPERLADWTAMRVGWDAVDSDDVLLEETPGYTEADTAITPLPR